jgi:hypothetical protein
VLSFLAAAPVRLFTEHKIPYREPQAGFFVWVDLSRWAELLQKRWRAVWCLLRTFFFFRVRALTSSQVLFRDVSPRSVDQAGLGTKI